MILVVRNAVNDDMLLMMISMLLMMISMLMMMIVTMTMMLIIPIAAWFYAPCQWY